MQLKEVLQRSMPGVRVDAAHYPPGGAKQGLSSLVTIVQWSVILATMGGEMAVNAVAGTPLQPTVLSMQANKMAAAGGAWFLGSSVSASLLKTGAFEVTVTGDGDRGEAVTVWSGRARGGRPPQTQEELDEIGETLAHARAWPLQMGCSSLTSPVMSYSDVSRS